MLARPNGIQFKGKIMPLNDTQKRLVEEILISQYQIKDLEIEIIHALLLDIDKENPFYKVKEYLLHPIRYFQKIIREENPVTVGEVKDYILDLITAQLTADENATGLWNRETIRSMLYNADWEKPFEVNTTPSDDNPWRFPPLKEKIYTRAIIKNVNFKKHDISVDIDVYIAGLIHSQQINIENYKANFSSIDAQNEYQENIKTRAAQTAENTAAKIALAHLAHVLNLSKATLHACESETAKKLVTHAYYFDLLINKKLSIKQITNLSAEQCNNLCWPPAIELMKKGILTINHVLQLSKRKKLILSHPLYFSMLQDGRINHTEISGIKNEHEALFYLHPYVTKLIESNKITFKQIPYLFLKLKSTYFKEFFFNENYFHFFLKNNVNWDKIYTVYEPTFALLNNKFLCHFVTNNIVDFNNIINSPKPNMLCLSEILTQACAIRLQKIFDQVPCKVDSILDTIDLLIKEFPAIAKECGKEFIQFKEEVLCLFFLNLKANLKERLKLITESNDNLAIYQRFLNTLLLAFENPTPAAFSEQLDKIIDFALQIKQALLRQDYLSPARDKVSLQDANPVLFQPLKRRRVNISDNNLFNFCDGLAALKPLNAVAEVIHNYRLQA